MPLDPVPASFCSVRYAHHGARRLDRGRRRWGGGCLIVRHPHPAQGASVRHERRFQILCQVSQQVEAVRDLHRCRCAGVGAGGIGS